MFLGVISDGGASGGTGGSLTKNGSATLTLDGDNSYSGGTPLLGGTLLADSTQALGMGSVTLVGGTPGPRRAPSVGYRRQLYAKLRYHPSIGPGGDRPRGMGPAECRRPGLSGRKP